MKKWILFILLITSATTFALNQKEIQEAYYKSYNYEKIENYTDAIKALLPIFNEYPNGYTVNLRLAWLYYLNQNYANSLEHYDNAIKISPNSLEAKLGRLLPLLAQTKYDQVESEAFQILNVDYFNYFGNLRLIYALRLQEKYDTAEKIALKMLAIYPIDIKFLTEYALVKSAQGEAETAVRVFNDILILDPENVTAKGFLKR